MLLDVLIGLYGYLVIVGLVALVLVALAQLRATSGQTAGRLLATMFTLAGLIIGGLGRVSGSLHVVLVGLVSIDVGLTLYVLYLPDRGLRHLVGRRRRQRKDHGGER